MGRRETAAASKSGDISCHKSCSPQLWNRFKSLVANIESPQGKIFLRRLGVACRSGWACLLAGLLLEYGYGARTWLAIPFFSLVICLNIVESNVGATVRNVLGVLLGLAQAMTIGLAVLSLLGTKLSRAPAVVCIFVASFLVSHNSNDMAKKVALSLIGMIFITAHTGQNQHSLYFLFQLTATTLFGAFCAVLAVLTPVPGLACCEARESARSVIRGSSELFQSLVEAFCATSREASMISSIFIHAKFLAKIAWTDIGELNSRQVHAIWELRAFGLIPTFKPSGFRLIPTFKRMVKGLNGLQLHILGMTLALQSGTSFLTPGVMSAILKVPLQQIGEKSKSILELTTNLSTSRVILLEKQKILEEARAEFEVLEQVILLAREETYKQEAVSFQNELRTTVPTHFFLFNLRMFFMETINMLDSGKIATKKPRTPISRNQILPVEEKVGPNIELPASNVSSKLDISGDNECAATTLGRCEYREPKITQWDACLTWLGAHGLMVDWALSGRAFKIALAMSMAALAALRFNMMYAIWANISVGFIVQQHQGGSFRMGMLRLQGTLLGAIYGYLAILATHDRPYLVLMSLIPWVTLLSYLRFTKILGPAGVIAGLTAAIVMLGTKIEEASTSIQDFALDRITENFIGVLCLVIVETLVLPDRAVTLSRQNLVSSLTGLRDCVANITAAYTGNYCPGHRRMVVHGIKKLEQDLRSRCAELAELHSEAAMEPDLWNLPFPAEIYSKLALIQGRMVDLLYFMISSLQAATEDCLLEQIETLRGPLETSLAALQDEVLPSLDLLQSLLQVKRHDILHVSKKLSWEEDEENQMGKTQGPAFSDLRKMVGHVPPLLVLECRQRAIDGTPLSMQATMDAFEVSYEVVSGLVATKRKNPTESVLSNSTMLSFSAVTFSMTSLLSETVELEKAVHELLHFENPWSVSDFGKTFPEALKNGNRR